MTTTTRKKDTAQDIAQRIAAGDFDGELMPVLEAIQSRFASQATGMRWQLALGDLTVTEDDLTLNEAYAIEKAAACNWAEIDPVRSANHCRAVVGVCLESRLGLTRDEVETRLGSLTVSELVDAISRAEVTPVPLD
jgi:hypothetical protein